MKSVRTPPGPKGNFLLGHFAEYSRDPLGFLTSCARDYGDVVSLRLPATRIYLLSDPQHIEQVLSAKNANFTIHGGMKISLTLRIFGRGLLTSEGKEWHRQRRLTFPLFSHSLIAKYGEIMVDETEQMLSGWNHGQTRDIHAAPFRKDRVRFTIRSESDPVEVYELDVWRRQTEKQTDTMSIMLKPAEDAGSGSLAIETPDKPTVNITHSAARNEFRETDTGKMFFGGLTAQELLGEWGKYDYKLTGEREIDGFKAFEIEGKVKNGQKSVIESNKFLLDTQDYLLLEMHLFDRSGKEMRIFRQKEIKTENGRTYVAKTEVENHIYNSKITIEILSREYPAALDDSMFSREKLRQSVQK